MDLQYTLEAYAMQLKNVPRTLVAVAGVVIGAFTIQQIRSKKQPNKQSPKG